MWHHFIQVLLRWHIRGHIDSAKLTQLTQFIIEKDPSTLKPHPHHLLDHVEKNEWINFLYFSDDMGFTSNNKWVQGKVLIIPLCETSFNIKSTRLDSQPEASPFLINCETFLVH